MNLREMRQRLGSRMARRKNTKTIKGRPVKGAKRARHMMNALRWPQKPKKPREVLP